MKTLEPADLGNILELEAVFGTTRFLPLESEIPREFFDGGNPYARIASGLFFGLPLDPGECEFRPGFEEVFLADGVGMTFLHAHLRSFEPCHERKIAGVAYLIKQILELQPERQGIGS